MSSIYDGGPMINAGVCWRRSSGLNAGVYRSMVKKKNDGHRHVTPNTRVCAARADAGRPCRYRLDRHPYVRDHLAGFPRARTGRCGQRRGIRARPSARAGETVECRESRAENVLEAEIMHRGDMAGRALRGIHPGMGECTASAREVKRSRGATMRPLLAPHAVGKPGAERRRVIRRSAPRSERRVQVRTSMSPRGARYGTQ